MNGQYMDWTTYLRDSPMTTYRGKVPNGPVNQFYEVPAGDFTLGKKVSKKCQLDIEHGLKNFNYD